MTFQITDLFLEIKIISITLSIVYLFFSIGFFPFIFLKKIKSLYLLIAPSIGLALISNFSVLLSLLGLTSKHIFYISLPFILISIIFQFKYLLNNFHSIFRLIKKNYILLLFPIIFVLVTGIYSRPLITEKFLTTVSMGNLDSFGYNLVSDFFKNHSLKTINKLDELPNINGYMANVEKSNRWGTFLAQSYLSSIFNVQSFQIFYVLSIALTLIILISTVFIFRNLSSYSIPTILFLIISIALNPNFYYLVTQSFLSQLIFINYLLLFPFFINKILKPKKINYLNILITTLFLTAILLNYSEGLIIVFFIIFVYCFLLVLKNNNLFGKIKRLFLILIFTLVINPFSLIWAMKAIIFQSQFVGIAGWSFPYIISLPEMIGLQDVNKNIPELNTLLILNFIIILILLLGIQTKKYHKILISFLLGGLMSIVFFLIIKNNSYAHYKISSSLIPIVSIIFFIGINKIFYQFPNKHKAQFLLMFLIIFTALNIYNSKEAFIKSYTNYASVNSEMRKLKLTKITTNKYYFLTDIPNNYWPTIWASYFQPQKQILSDKNYDVYVSARKPEESFNITTLPILYLSSEKEFIENHFPISEKIMNTNYYNISTFNNLLMFDKGFDNNEYISKNKLFRWMTEEGIIKIFNGKDSSKQLCINLTSFQNNETIQFSLDNKTINKIVVPPINFIKSCFNLKPNTINTLKLTPVDHVRINTSASDPRNLIININNFSFN